MGTVIKLLATILLNSISTFLIAQETILWRISANQSQDTSYVLGTYHIMGNSFIDTIPIVLDIVKNSTTIIFESVDDKYYMISKINQRPISNEYAKHLSKKEQNLISALSENWIVDFRKLSAIELYLKLQQEYIKSVCKTVSVLDTIDNLDNYLLSISKTYNKNIIGLESDSLQISDLNSLFQEVRWKEIRKWIKRILKDIRKNNDKTSLCQIADDYKNFNFDYQFNIACSDTNLIQRNDSWIPQIISNIESGNTLIVVGLLHLFGDCGLISALRDKGYSVEPVRLR